MNTLLILNKFRAPIAARFREAIAYKGVNEAEYQVMDVIAGGETRPANIAQIAGLHASSVSRILPILLKHKIINKKTSEADSRAYDVNLTAYGKKLHKELKPKAEEAMIVEDSEIRKLSKILRGK